MNFSNQQRQYLSDRVQTASPVELIGLLYETALQAVAEALRCLHSGDILGRGRAITKALEMLSELRASLRVDVHPEYSSTLAGLYGYLQRQLIRAHSEQADSILQEATRLLQTLLEGWNGGMKEPDRRDTSERAELSATPIAHLNPYSPGLAQTGSQGRSWQL